MKDNKKYLKYAILLLILSITVPILTDYLIIGNRFTSNINNHEWVTFLGSYIGALIGSTATLIGILITLKFTREQANEDRRLALAPYLKYTMNEKTLLDRKHDIRIFHVIDENYNTYVNATISIKNIGMGPVLYFYVNNITFNDQLFNFTINGNNDVLEKNSEWLMLIDFRLRLDEIKNETLIKTPPGSLVEYKPPIECMKKEGVLFFNIGYKDLIGNEYEQDVKIIMSVGCEGKAGGIEWKYSQPQLRLDNVGKVKRVN